MKIKILTGIYVFILAVIVLLADVNGTGRLLEFVGEMHGGDKIGHFILTGLFALLLNAALHLKKIRIARFGFPLGGFIVAIVATLEEFSQIYVGGRNFDAGDLAADYAGIIVFGALASVFYSYAESKRLNEKIVKRS